MKDILKQPSNYFIYLELQHAFARWCFISGQKIMKEFGIRTEVTRKDK